MGRLEDNLVKLGAGEEGRSELTRMDNLRLKEVFRKSKLVVVEAVMVVVVVLLLLLQRREVERVEEDVGRD